MSETRFCRICDKETKHDTHADIFGIGERSNIAERLFFGVVTAGLSEMAKTTRRECQECGKVTKA